MRRLPVSTSETNTFDKCMHKWWLRYVQGWTPSGATEAQTRGTVGHHGLEVMYRAIRDGDVRDRNSLVVSACRGIAEWIKQAIEDGKELDPDLFDQMSAALTRYIDHFVVSDLSKGVRPLLVEEPFAELLRNENGSAAQHVVHISKLDLGVVDGEDLVLHEHKFTDDDCSTFDARFDVDPQMPGYVYDLIEGQKQGRIDPRYRLGRVVLNVIRRKGPSRPRVNKVTKRDCSTLNTETNKWVLNEPLWSALEGSQEMSGNNQGLVSVAACDTTRQVYRQALEEQAARGLSITDEQRKFMDGLPIYENKWIARHEHYYTDRDIMRWQLDMHTKARLIRLVHAGKLRPVRSGSACFPRNALPCEVRDMCVNELREPLDPENWIRLDQSVEGRLKRLHKDG